MKLMESFKSHILVSISVYELETIRNVLDKVHQSISISAFSIRMGCSIQEFQKFFETISNSLSKNYNNRDVLISKIHLNLSNKELHILSQSLNEVCHGIYVSNFQKIIGMEKDKLKLFLEHVLEWLDNQKHEK